METPQYLLTTLRYFHPQHCLPVTYCPNNTILSGHHHSIPVTRALPPPCHCHLDTATPVSVPKALPLSLGTASLVPRYCLPSSLFPEHCHCSLLSLSPGHSLVTATPPHCHPWALPLTPIPVPHHFPPLSSTPSCAQGTSVTAVSVPVPWTPASLQEPVPAAQAWPLAMPVTVPQAPSGPSASTGW